MAKNIQDHQAIFISILVRTVFGGFLQLSIPHSVCCRECRFLRVTLRVRVMVRVRVTNSSYGSSSSYDSSYVN